MKIFEFLTEAVGWLQIVASPLLVGAGIGAIVYFSNPNSTTYIIAISIAILGFVIGVLWATKIWKKTGTISFLSKIHGISELDKKDEATKKNQ